MITGLTTTDKGFCFTWHGKPVPQSTQQKIMSHSLRLYMVVMGELAEKKESGLFHLKLRACQKVFDKKGPEYANILRHFENMEEWLS